MRGGNNRVPRVRPCRGESTGRKHSTRAAPWVGPSRLASERQRAPVTGPNVQLMPAPEPENRLYRGCYALSSCPKAGRWLMPAPEPENRLYRGCYTLSTCPKAGRWLGTLGHGSGNEGGQKAKAWPRPLWTGARSHMWATEHRKE